MVVFMYQLYYFVFQHSYFLLLEDSQMGLYVNNYDLSLPLFIISPIFNSRIDNYSEYLIIPIHEIIMPGFFLNYLYRFDKKVKLHSMLFFLTGLIVFIISLGLRTCFLNYLGVTVPAFITCFPLLSIVVFLLAFKNQVLEEMFSGFNENVYDESEVEGKRLNSFALSYYEASNLSDDTMQTGSKQPLTSFMESSNNFSRRDYFSSRKVSLSRKQSKVTEK